MRLFKNCNEYGLKIIQNLEIKIRPPNEFGNMVMVAQTVEKFISDYEVMEKNKSDTDQVDPIFSNHKRAFGSYPEKCAADKGFHKGVKKTQELAKKVRLVCIPKKGKSTFAETLKEHSPEFQEKHLKDMFVIGEKVKNCQIICAAPKNNQWVFC